MQHHVSQTTLSWMTDAGRQQLAHRVGRNTVHRAAKVWLILHTEVCLHHEWVQEQFAELLVAVPRVTLATLFKRSGINELWTRSDELHVVRSCIFQTNAIAQGLTGELQLQQRSIFQHGERPLVWVRNEGQHWVSHRGLPRSRETDSGGLHNGGLNQFARGKSILDGLLVPNGLDVLGSLFGECANNATISNKHPA